MRWQRFVPVGVIALVGVAVLFKSLRSGKLLKTRQDETIK